MTDPTSHYDEIKVEMEIKAAELVLNGLMAMCVELAPGDFAAVNGPLKQAIWGDGIGREGVVTHASLQTDETTGLHCLELNHVPNFNAKETFLTLHVGCPEPYEQIAATMSFSQTELASLWERGREDILAEERRLAAAAQNGPQDSTAAASAKMFEVLHTVLQYVAGENPERSPITVFEEWLELTGRTGGISMVKNLPMAA